MIRFLDSTLTKSQESSPNALKMLSCLTSCCVMYCNLWAGSTVQYKGRLSLEVGVDLDSIHGSYDLLRQQVTEINR
jgi:hypothetical protein